MIYGKFLHPTAFAKEGTYVRHPQNAVDGGDMSGYGGMRHTRGVDLEKVWLSARDVTHDVWIGFDFGSVVRLGYMAVWNLNQTDGYGAGIKRAKIYYSCDNGRYEEWKGEGYPFVFACADGKEGLRATNLDDGRHSPVNFNGLSARYIKIVPDIESGEGCHGPYIEGQTRYGLSQVRFFQYHVAPQGGCELYARSFCPEMDVLTSGYGLTDGKQGTDETSMYLSDANPQNMDLVFDLDMCVMLKGIDFINYNEPYKIRAGIRQFDLFYSLDGLGWTKQGSYRLSMASGKEETVTYLENGELLRFTPIFARFIKITVAGGAGIGTHGCVNGFEFRYGLSKIRFIAADEGYYTEPARDWTAVLSSYENWTGADGIFITSIDGKERKPKGKERNNVKNVITFGDTFIGKVNPVTGSRLRADFVNNSLCYLEGLDPENLRTEFVYGKNGENTISNLIANQKNYTYWLQDCVITGGRFYAFTDNVVSDNENLSLPEGFRFHLTGVDMVMFDIRNGRLDYASQKNMETPFFVTGKKNLMFGCAIFANTEEAGMEKPDGYIYVYGIWDIGSGIRHLVVARTRPEHIADFDRYTFFDGAGWSADIEDCAAIADDLSPEMSVMPVDFGRYRGKYAFVYSANGVSNHVMMRIGETPWGPFDDIVPLYSMNRIDDLDMRGLKKVYQYNAKAHFNIAQEDEILMTYNVNCMDYESHLLNGNIYRPRFLRYKEF